MEHLMEWCRFARFTIQLYLPLVKDLSDEEQHQLISILTTPISWSGLKLESQKVMLIDSHSISTSALWSVISLCEDLNKEILMLGRDGAAYCKNVKQLENLIFFLKEIQIKIIQEHTKTTDLKFI